MFKRTCLREHVMTGTSEGVHLFLDACEHTEVKHQLCILLRILHGYHLYTQRDRLKFRTRHGDSETGSETGSCLTSSSPLGFRSTAEKPWTLDDGQNWKFNLRVETGEGCV